MNPPLLLEPRSPFPLAAFLSLLSVMTRSVSILESGSPSSPDGWFFSCCLISLKQGENDLWPDWLPPANLLYFGFESGLVLEVFSPFFVDFLHLRLDVGQHGVTVVTPGTQYRDNVADISFPASLMILAGYQYCARSNLCNYLISLPMT